MAWSMGSGQQDGRYGPRRDAAVQRRRAGSRSTRASTPARRPTRGSTRTPSSDEIHQSQRNLRGVARTKLDLRHPIATGSASTGTVENRDVKEVYIADYDGANQRRITVSRQLNISPDLVARRPLDCLHVVAHRLPGHLHLADLRRARCRTRPRARRTRRTGCRCISPDGTKIAFTSNRDGNPEIYIMNVDGSGLRRLTNHPAIDTTPTWSPTGTQIAFTSDRGGTPSIYIVGVDGLGLRRITFENSDRATWSPAPRNEIAYTARTGPGYDIKVLNLADGRNAADHVWRRHATRARPGRPTAGTSRSRRRARAARRSSRSITTARTCARSRATATTSSRTGRSRRLGFDARFAARGRGRRFTEFDARGLRR